MRERLTLYFLLAVFLPLAFGTLVSERLVERHIIGLAREGAHKQLDAVAGRLEDRARFVQMGLTQLATSRELVAATAAADAGMAASSLRAARMPRQLDLLALVSIDGNLISSTRGPRDHSTFDLKPDAALRRALTGETVTSYEELDGVLVQAVTVPVREHDRVLGALLGATTLTGNDPLCAHLVERAAGDAAVVHRGAWVASSGGGDDGDRSSSMGPPLSPEQTGPLLRHARWAGPWPGHGPGQSARFVALGPLTNSAGQVVGAVAGLVSTSGLAALQLDARRSFFAAMGLGALVSLLLALLAVRRMAAPLRRLAQAATAMQQGRLDVPIAVEGDGEVAQLALALREMAQALSQSMSTLESRVEQRVHELREAHDREATLNHELVAQNEQLRAQGQTLRAQGRELERQRGELVEKTRRSEEADRVKSAFIANMSHEIRTPLNSVLALSQLLRDGMAGALSADQRRYLEVIERNGQNLLRLINDILDLSRIEAGHLDMDLQKVDLGAQVRATVGTLVPLAEAKGLDLRARLPGELPAVRCDVDRVRQILTNLIGNAIKFTEVGHVEVSAEVGDEMVAVHVTDTGVGIPDAARDKVFEEFFQVDPSMARRQQGTGLGLAIASRLAHLMGGEISLDRAPGAGSRFTLSLPRSLPEHDALDSEAVVAPSPTLAPALGPARDSSILIVEDNEDNLFTLRQILNGLSVELGAAASGREAIEHCRRSLPGLIVMDMQLPGMSGLETAGAIRALPGGPTIPIIALTAQAMRGDRERILAAGCDEYLSKPIQPKALLAAILRLLRRHDEHLDGRTGAPAEEEEHGTHTPGR
jgi:signal transduction histidine kinase/ActR/RegA family two-component response regulator